MANSVEGLIQKAGANHWCTKMVCTTCGATEFRKAVGQLAVEQSAFADDLERMDVTVWYALEDVGGAIGIVFSALSSPERVDTVLASWRPRFEAQTRLIDAVLFRVVRTGLASDSEAAQWIALAREEALQTRDPSLLESLVYVLGPRLVGDSVLLAAAVERRRGYAPLHRALNKTIGPSGADA